MLQRDTLVRTHLKMSYERSVVTTYTEDLSKLDARCDMRLFELFISSVKDQDAARAFDYAQLFELRDTLEKASNLANSANMTFLSSKLQMLLNLRRAKRLARQCQLPLEADMTDRDRDALVKKMMLEIEKNKKAIETVDQRSASWIARPDGAAPSSVSSAPAPSSSHITPTKRSEAQVEEDAPVLQISASKVSKRVTFVEQEVAATATALAASATAEWSLRASHVVAAKPSSPPSKPSAPGTTTALPKPAAPFSRVSKAPVSSAAVNQSTAPIAAPAPIPKPVPQSPPAAASSSTATSTDPSTPVPAAAVPAKSQPTATLVKPVIRHQPVDALSEPAPAFLDLPVDPFLSQGQSDVKCAGILDIGHADESSQALPRSESFGDALRKRYRSEDDEDEEDAAPRPVLTFAR